MTDLEKALFKAAGENGSAALIITEKGAYINVKKASAPPSKTDAQSQSTQA